MTVEQMLEDKDFKPWFDERPQIIKDAILKVPPIGMYRFKDSKKECYITGYTEPDEDIPNSQVTLIVQKIGKGGALAEMGEELARKIDANQVFDVGLDDLEFINNDI